MDVFYGDDTRTTILFGGDAGAVNPRPEACSGYLIHPGIDIGFLFRQHPAAFFLIEKDYRPRGKTLAPCGCNGHLGIGFA